MAIQISEAQLAELFPRERTDAFFEALFGGAEEGAYDIYLVPDEGTDTNSDNELRFYFELRQRPGHCLVCSLTYGLPQVFERHPIINVKGLIGEISRLVGWNADEVWWRIGSTQSISDALHRIPLTLLRQESK